MHQQLCFDGVELLPLPRDPQFEMINRCLRFQSSLGTYDERLFDVRSQFCLPKVALHHLDMARQECAEAYDLLEGGWKHHKKNPRSLDRGELLMELVDVAHFIFNAYLFCGGQPESALVGAAVSISDQQIKIQQMSMDDAWHIGKRSWNVNGEALENTYGYGHGAHGDDLSKALASRVNALTARLSSATETIRAAFDKGGVSMHCPGFVYIETMPWLYACVHGLCQGDDQQRQAEFYSAFVHKNDMNFARQRQNY